MICTNCRKTISDSSIFCEHCGKKIVIEESSEDQKSTTQMPKLYKEVINHLEFLGYVVDSNSCKDDLFDTVLKHASKHNYILRFRESIGTNFSIIFRFNKEKAQKKKLDVLEAINQLNNTSSLVTFAISKDFDFINCFAWFPPLYSKSHFSSFINLIDGDIDRLINDEEMKKFY